MSTMLRSTLLAAARSERLAGALPRLPGTRGVVRRFVAGTTIDDVAATAEAVLQSGRAVSIDHLGEHTTERARAAATVAHYCDLLTVLGRTPWAQTGLPVRPLEISVKLSALGQALPRDGHAIALDHAHRVCEAARAAGIWVSIDAEDHTTTDSTLAIVTALRTEFPWVGAVVQAYLRRSEADCRDLSGAGSRVRLCKGAYAEPAALAYIERAEVDDSYRRCLATLIAGAGYPMVASHDPAMITAAGELLEAQARSTDEYEYQMLYGIRDDEQRRLAAAGHQVRVYLPFGEQWYGYFMRRLAERPANLRFFLRALADTRHI